MNKMIVDCSSGDITQASYTTDEQTWIQGIQQAENKPQDPSIEDRLSSVESAISSLMGV